MMAESRAYDLDVRHHLGANVGSPACLVIDRLTGGAPCPADGIYRVTAADRFGRFSFGSCVEHTALLREVGSDSIRVEMVASDGSGGAA